MIQEAHRETAVETKESSDERKRWKPAANHPWRQYRSVYLHKKRMTYLKQHALAEELFE